MNRIVYLNGEYVEEAEAKVSIFDRALLFSDALYEVTSVLDGKLIDFDNHMKRLDRSMSELKYPRMLNHEEIKIFHKELVKKNKLTAGFKKLALTLFLMFTGPVILYQAFSNIGHQWYYFVLVIGLIVCILSIFTLFSGIKSIINHIFDKDL